MIRRRFLFALPAVPSASSRAFAQPVNTLPGMTTVTFPPGSNTSTLAGQLGPGGRNVYYVQAKAGQTLMVSVMPVATGISFQVFRADASLAKGADGLPVVSGGTLPDAGPTDNATAWIGAIPVDGNYLILVALRVAAAATPGPYNLTVSLK
ncbi:hypothetical protein SAMN02990966_01330 [Rhodospirillales bacterium URHD0017]|nr:hypothetical protein SAMN02990966_01330 [Rhodospirillales bacterium URHD0017]